MDYIGIVEKWKRVIRMIYQPPLFKCLTIRIPITIPMKGRGLMNHGSGFVCSGSV